MGVEGARVCRNGKRRGPGCAIVGIRKREVCRNGEEMESQGLHYTGMGNGRGGGQGVQDGMGKRGCRPECPGMWNRQCWERIGQGVQEREIRSVGRRVDQGVKKWSADMLEEGEEGISRNGECSVLEGT